MRTTNLGRSLSALLAVTVVGCGLIEGIIDEAAIDRARERGGNAIIFGTGEAFVLEVDDENSPIYGAAVSFPADALPSGVQKAFMKILPSAEFDSVGAERTVVGPGVSVVLTEFESEERIDGLVTAATVFVPYVADDVTVATDLLGVLHRRTGEPLTTLTAGRRVELDRQRVVGETLRFSDFAAVVDLGLAADEDGELAVQVGPCWIEHDLGDNGVVDRMSFHTMLTSGRGEFQATVLGDHLSPGQSTDGVNWDEQTFVQHDSKNRVNLRETYEGGDLSRRVEYLFGVGNDPATAAVERDGSGSILTVRRYEVHWTGTVTASTAYDGFGGEILRAERWFVSGSGPVTMHTIDDGNAVLRQTIEHTDSGLIERATTVDSTGKAVRVETYAYDEFDRAIEIVDNTAGNDGQTATADDEADRYTFTYCDGAFVNRLWTEPE